MIVSALLTSVGINFGLCVLFFTLYSILRRLPVNINVYAPRLVAEAKAQQSSDFKLERLLPSPGWVKRAWQTSEEELLSTSGLDAVVFMRIFTFSIKVFSVAVVVGILVLLPVNLAGDQLKDFDFSDISNTSLDLFSIANIEDNSNWLWIHFSAVYFITVVVCALLFYEYKYISEKRIAFFNSSKRQPHQFTILVRGIPSSTGKGFSDAVDSFFTEYHPSTYISHMIVRRTSNIHGLMSDMKKLYKRLAHLKSNGSAKPKFQRRGFMGLFGPKVDAVDHCEKKLQELEATVKMGQSDISLSGEEVPAAYVSFNSRYGAAIAHHMQQSIDPRQWSTEQAPEPHDVCWPFFTPSFLRRWVYKMAAHFSTTAVTVLFLIPVVFVQGLTDLDKLQTFFPFLKGILTIAFVSEVVTGYLPSLILQLFLFFVPSIMKLFSSIQGYASHSEIEKSACHKVLFFTIWNIFFANVLSGSVLYPLLTLFEPKTILTKLAVAVPGQASFFITYVVTFGWTSLSSELFQMTTLIYNFIKQPFVGSAGDDPDVPSIPYHSEIPSILFFGLLGLTYFILAPLILPFLLVYYCLGYIIYRNQILNVYAPKYETGGRFWPIVHNSTIFSLIMLQALAIGILWLKKLAIAASLIGPLLGLTLVFNGYCRRRFLPIFKAYSAESLIKKDREDQNDPAMAEFLDKLVTAYRDPALMPIQLSGNISESRTPLLMS